jgi:hypothetical protein
VRPATATLTPAVSIAPAPKRSAPRIELRVGDLPTLISAATLFGALPLLGLPVSRRPVDTAWPEPVMAQLLPSAP